MSASSAENGARVSKTEKRAILLSAIFVAASVALIGYATWGIGIHVPSSMPQEKPFAHGAVVRDGGKHYEVHFVARMWNFEPSRVRVPVGSTVDIELTSADVLHGFQIVGTNVNLMAVPGVVTPASVHFTKPGRYLIVCHEFCGAAHQNMNGQIEVSADATDISAEGLPSADAARKILDDKGCLACHSLDGSPGVGPTLKGAWGQPVPLADGTVRTLDADFLREIIQHPEKYRVKGFEPVMPALPVSEEELEQIREYLEGLK